MSKYKTGQEMADEYRSLGKLKDPELAFQTTRKCFVLYLLKGVFLCIEYS